MPNAEALTRYSTAKEYVETIKLAISSPHYRGQHVMMAIRPTHLLLGFSLELYMKAWLLADGVLSRDTQQHGHRLLDLLAACERRGIAISSQLRALIIHVAEPHGQAGEFTFRYTRENAIFEPVRWAVALLCLDELDVLVDTKVGASASFGLAPGH